MSKERKKDIVVLVLGFLFLFYNIFFSKSSIFEREKYEEVLKARYKEFVEIKKEIKRLYNLLADIESNPSHLKLWIYRMGIYGDDVIRVKFVLKRAKGGTSSYEQYFFYVILLFFLVALGLFLGIYYGYIKLGRWRGYRR